MFAVPLISGNSQQSIPQVVSSSWLRSVSTPPEAVGGCGNICFTDDAEGEPAAVVLAAAAPDEPEVAQPVEPQPFATPEPTPYIQPWATMEVRSGDTLSELAQWFGVSALSIASANGAGVEEFIQVGDTLVIPIAESTFVLPPEPAIPAAEEAVAPPEEVFVPEEPEFTPTPTPSPTPYIPVGPQEVIDAICSLPWDCETMVRIATCESGLNPNAFNPAGYYGLFQINFEFDGWNDPWVNAQVAYDTKYLPALAGGDPLVPWPACRYY